MRQPWEPHDDRLPITRRDRMLQRIGDGLTRIVVIACAGAIVAQLLRALIHSAR
jgi:hypothetical protein